MSQENYGNGSEPGFGELAGDIFDQTLVLTAKFVQKAIQGVNFNFDAPVAAQAAVFSLLVG